MGQYSDVRRRMYGHVPADYDRECAVDEIVGLLYDLTNDEGHGVEILCENPEGTGPDNNCVVVRADWTQWQELRFYAQTVLDALRKALEAKRVCEAGG